MLGTLRRQRVRRSREEFGWQFFAGLAAACEVHDRRGTGNARSIATSITAPISIGAVQRRHVSCRCGGRYIMIVEGTS